MPRAPSSGWSPSPDRVNRDLCTDILVLGCGIGGSVAALTLADAGVPVTVITRAEAPTESNTHYAQGGVIYRGDGDSADLLAEDIVRAGAGLCHRPAVEIAATEGPGLVERILIDRVGVPFDRDASGRISLAREGSHSVSRVAHVADATGRAIAAALVGALKALPNVTLLTRHTAVELSRLAEHAEDPLKAYAPTSCTGAYVLDQSADCVVCDLIGLRNSVQSAFVVARAALANTRSIGCHYRRQ